MFDLGQNAGHIRHDDRLRKALLPMCEMVTRRRRGREPVEEQFGREGAANALGDTIETADIYADKNPPALS